MFGTEPLQAWLINGGLYLLYDFLHLLKNVWNNWLKEKMGELVLCEKETKKLAIWIH